MSRRGAEDVHDGILSEGEDRDDVGVMALQDREVYLLIGTRRWCWLQVLLLHVGEVGGVGFIVGDLIVIGVVIIAVMVVVVVSPGFARVHNGQEGGRRVRDGEFWTVVGWCVCSFEGPKICNLGSIPKW